MEVVVVVVVNLDFGDFRLASMCCPVDQLLSWHVACVIDVVKM